MSPMISFILDDAFISQYNNLNIFEARDVKVGFAITKVQTQTAGRMSFAQLKELQYKGNEILNHSYSHIAYTGTIIDQSEQEIQQGYEDLVSMGFKIEGFVTPNSQIYNINRIPIIATHHSYAFTIYNELPETALLNENDSTTAYNLHRYECSDLTKSKQVIDAVIASNGLAVFYSHDIGAVGSVSASALAELLDYAIQNNVEIVLPREIAKEFSLRKNQSFEKPTDTKANDNVFSGYFLMGIYNSVDATFQDQNNNHTITINSSSNIGDLVVSNIFNNHIESCENEEFVFKLNAKSSLAQMQGITIGIRALRNSDNSEIARYESSELVIDGNNRKYKVSIGTITSSEPFYFNMFYRLKNVGANNMVINVDNFCLYSGVKSEIIDVSEMFESTIITLENTTLQNNLRTIVNMTPQENDFLRVEQQKTTFLQDGYYQVDVRCNCTLAADFNGARIISAFTLHDGSFGMQSDKSAIKNRANFDNSIAKYFKAGETLKFHLFQSTGQNQTILKNIDYNLISVLKIK